MNAGGGHIGPLETADTPLGGGQIVASLARSLRKIRNPVTCLGIYMGDALAVAY